MNESGKTWYNNYVEGVGNFLFSPQKAVILLDKFPPSTRAKTSRIAAFCVIVEGKMKLIPLTQGKVAKVDNEDFEWLSKFKWSYVAGRPNGYARRGSGGKKSTPIRMHREIMGVHAGTMIDHINGDTLDNRKSNLRTCTIAENNRNSSMRKNNKSGYKGVYKIKLSRGWTASIKVNGVIIHLGSYSTPEEAARRYDKAALLYHGKFSKLNFPPEGEA